MSKPWSDESAPIIISKMYIPRVTDWVPDNDNYVVDASDALDLERRMRAAEKLLEQSKYPYDGFYARVKAHLEAARKEDKHAIF